MDLITANQGSSVSEGSVALVLGVTGTSYAPPVHYLSGRRWRSVAAGDFDSDGDPDLVTSNLDGQVALLRNDGSGGLIPDQEYQVGRLALDAVVADLNRDSQPDLAVTSLSSNMLTLFYNGKAQPQTHVRFGQRVSITSSGEGYQELFYNFTTTALSVSSYSSASARHSYPLSHGHWIGIFHYDYASGRFTQALYTTGARP